MTSTDRLPPLLSSRPPGLQVVLAGVVPAIFGAICGWALGVSEGLYLVLAVPVAILGGFLAGLEHPTPASAAARGVVAGALFGGFILIAHEVIGKEAKADLPHPGIVLAIVTAVIGALLGAAGAAVRRRMVRRAA
jgi:hypothetical protein